MLVYGGVSDSRDVAQLCQRVTDFFACWQRTCISFPRRTKSRSCHGKTAQTPVQRLPESRVKAIPDVNLTGRCAQGVGHIILGFAAVRDPGALQHMHLHPPFYEIQRRALWSAHCCTLPSAGLSRTIERPVGARGVGTGTHATHSHIQRLQHTHTHTHPRTRTRTGTRTRTRAQRENAFRGRDKGRRSPAPACFYRSEL